MIDEPDKKEDAEDERTELATPGAKSIPDPAPLLEPWQRRRKNRHPKPRKIGEVVRLVPGSKITLRKPSLSLGAPYVSTLTLGEEGAGSVSHWLLAAHGVLRGDQWREGIDKALRESLYLEARRILQTTQAVWGAGSPCALLVITEGYIPYAQVLHKVDQLAAGILYHERQAPRSVEILRFPAPKTGLGTLRIAVADWRSRKGLEWLRDLGHDLRSLESRR